MGATFEQGHQDGLRDEDATTELHGSEDAGPDEFVRVIAADAEEGCDLVHREHVGRAVEVYSHHRSRTRTGRVYGVSTLCSRAYRVREVGRSRIGVRMQTQP